jgi:transcriptional/translational regulatory protein YebC/TACO1
MRTTPEIRHAFSKHGGNLGEPNSVSWMFEKKGLFVVSTEAASEERLMEIALDAGADDLQREDAAFEIYTSPETFPHVQRALETAGIAVVEATIAMKPRTSCTSRT